VFARELRVQSIARDRKGDKNGDNLEKKEQTVGLCIFRVANTVGGAL